MERTIETYRTTDEDGAFTDFEAISWDDAMLKSRRWAAAGDWGDESYVVRMTIESDDETREATYIHRAQAPPCAKGAPCHDFRPIDSRQGVDWEEKCTRCGVEYVIESERDWYE